MKAILHHGKPEKLRPKKLRQGWTTGLCAAAAAKAAWGALCHGHFDDPVEVSLDRGRHVSFPLVNHRLTSEYATAAVVKDAGDDPDITHGSTVMVRVERHDGDGIIFQAGPGVGTVSRPGLPLAVGEAAINPSPRRMISQAMGQVQTTGAVAARVEISIPGGEEMAKKTWNPRLGITGGLSILGTTGIVKPYSCSAWIHAIRSGIEVALAAGCRHLAGATGSTSETMVRRLHGLDEMALIDMGDFVGGMLKCLRRKKLDRLTIAGGFAKICKLAQGNFDLHSARSQVDFSKLAERLRQLGASGSLCRHVTQQTSALAVLEMTQEAQLPLAGALADDAYQMAKRYVANDAIEIDVVLCDRSGRLIGRSSG